MSSLATLWRKSDSHRLSPNTSPYEAEHILGMVFLFLGWILSQRVVAPHSLDTMGAFVSLHGMGASAGRWRLDGPMWS